MKKHNIIFPPLLLTLTTMPFSVPALTASGTVFDEANEPVIGAVIYKIDSSGQARTITATDIDGKFKVDNFDGIKLKITYVGTADQIVEPGENLRIQLEANNQISEVVVAGCTNETKAKLNAKETKNGAKGACIPTECIGEPGEYEIKGTSFLDEDSKQCTPTKFDKDGAAREVCEAICVKVKCTNSETQELHAIEGKVENGKCVPSTCIQDYKLKGNVCVKYQCSTAEKESVLKSGAKGAKWDGTKCVPSKCDTDNGYTENANNECVLTNCTKAQLQELKKQQGVADGKLENGTCVPICKKNYHLNETTQKCEENKCPTAEEDWNGKECVKVRCTEEQKQAIYAKEAKWENNTCVATDCEENKNFKLDKGKCVCKENYSLENGACVSKKVLEEKQKAYDEAKATEQSTENKTLTALTTAATGIGGMQLMQGMAEQSSDDDAVADMTAYIETMRCTYGDGQQVKAGPDEIELPGANDQELMNLRGEYLALAADLKERKTALGMKPGIESETIMDRASTGLYDDENIGITSGNYASLYRAMMLGSESDQAKIDDASKTSSNRVKYGAIAAGAGVVGGILGNELINGKLGEKLKEKNQGKALRAAVEIEKDALEDMKKCLKDAGIKDTDGMEFQNFYISVLSVKNINCKREITKIGNTKPSDIAAKTIFADSNNANEIYNKLIESFGPTIAGKMIGVTLSQQPTDVQKQNAINTLKSGIDKVTKRFQDAAKEDEKRLSSSGLKDFDIDFSSILSSFNGDGASSSIMDMVNNGFK